ncbi:MAG TPA: phytanoyl-CoA dioxygenase family protein [Candidatus Kapabacteria bacterium]|jgi:ectoine hydroxylase-related dioxygenase (phytanoyl-CoA dioxygenase family)
MRSFDAPRLDSNEIAFYNAKGYLLYRKPVLHQSKFQALKEHFEGKLSLLPADVRPEQMDVPHFTDIKLFDWLFADEILDLVEPIIGPDIALFSSHFISKPAGSGKRVPWHEDASYWKKMIDPIEVVTVWLAIDDSEAENGCMYVIPGTQGHGFSDYDSVDPNQNLFPIEIKKGRFDASRAVPCELKANEASLHHSGLIHGSPPNLSIRRRTGYTMRYMPTTVKALGGISELGHSHINYLARGQDRVGNHYGDPTKIYPELARYRELSIRKGH